MFDPGSFRDPSGRVQVRGKQVLRAVFGHGRASFEAARAAGVHDKAIAAGRLVEMRDADPAVLAGLDPAPCHVVEHPCLDFISYPYEWTFSG